MPQDKAAESEEDDDVIEILDSPVKVSEDYSYKRSLKEDGLAPVFNMFTKPEHGSSKGKHLGSSPAARRDTKPKPEVADDSFATSRQEKRRIADELDDDRSIKKSRPDPLKQAQPLLYIFPSDRRTPQRLIPPLLSTSSLAERVRPSSLKTFVGQSDLVGQGSLLRSMLETESSSTAAFGSIILWGPPGSGKTTMARLIANRADADFRELSATSSGTADVRKVFEQARNQLKLLGRRTVLFIDEIHRFTKPQQDLFLPFVETGSVTLIGATTENPSFKVNGALLSRCRVFTLNKLTSPELEQILKNALESYPPPLPRIPSTLLAFLAEVSDGDARQALNSLELALSVCTQRTSIESHMTEADAEAEAEDKELMSAIKRGLRKGYDRTGEERYDMISALHKSIRGSDGSAALYWLARMLEGGEDPLYIARRLIVVASEDVGLGDPHGLPLAMACHQACQVIGMPECRLNLAHCVAYLSEAQKSTRAYEAYGKAVALANETPLPGVPLQIRNAPTSLMKTLGYGKHYSYNPDFKHPVHNEYLPAELQERSSFGSNSLLQSASDYSEGKDKTWDESRLRDWEWKQNKGNDWPGRIQADANVSTDA